MKKHAWHSSHTGSVAEKLVSESLTALKLRHDKEKVANSKAQSKTSKGEFDFRVHFETHDHCIEVKSKAGNITLPTATNSNPNIKTHQLRNLRLALLDGNKAGILLNFRIKEVESWFYLSIKQFDAMIYNESFPLRAITPSLAEKYGIRIEVSESGKLKLKSVID